MRGLRDRQWPDDPVGGDDEDARRGAHPRRMPLSCAVKTTLLEPVVTLIRADPPERVQVAVASPGLTTVTVPRERTVTRFVGR